MANKEKSKLERAQEAAAKQNCACFGTTFRVHSTHACPLLKLLKEQQLDLERFDAFLARAV